MIRANSLLTSIIKLLQLGKKKKKNEKPELVGPFLTRCAEDHFQYESLDLQSKVVKLTSRNENRGHKMENKMEDKIKKTMEDKMESVKEKRQRQSEDFVEISFPEKKITRKTTRKRRPDETTGRKHDFQLKKQI